MKRTLAALILVCMALPTQAHHGFRMDYDASRAYWIEGTIKNGYYGQPHAEFDLVVIRDAAPPASYAPENARDLMGKLEASPGFLFPVQEIEFPQQKQFYDLGDVLKTGDRVAVIALRGCESPHPLRAQWILLPDGSSLRAKGKVQAEVKTCARTRSKD